MNHSNRRRASLVILSSLLVFGFVLSGCKKGDNTSSASSKVSTKTSSGVTNAVKKLEITTKPTKTTYLVGETFDKTGMVVTATLNDGTTKTVTDYKIDKTGALTMTDNAVTISYGGKVAILSITVTIDVTDMLTITNADNAVYTVEAEAIDYKYCMNSNDHTIKPNIEGNADANGKKSIGGLGLAGNVFGFGVESDVDATLTIVMRSAAVSLDNVLDDNLAFTWDDAITTCETTLPWVDGNFWNWQHAYYKNLSLKKGRNTLIINMITSLAPNIDCFYFVVSPTGDEKIGPTTSTTPADYKTYLNVTSDAKETYTIEAENIDYTGCINSNNPDGTPNAEEPDNSSVTGKTTSGGKSIGGLGVAGNKFGLKINSTVETPLNIDMVASDGTREDISLDSCMTITWNGVEVRTGKTLAWNGNWWDWEDCYLNGLTLAKGDNTLEISIISHAPNIDCFKFDVNPEGTPAVKPTYAEFLSIKSTLKETYQVEAEALDYSTCVSSNNPAGHPNIEYPTNSAETGKTTSGGAEISSLGVAGNKFGMKVTSTVVSTFDLDIVMSNGAPSDQVVDDLLKITWNGTEVKTNTTLTWGEKYFDWNDAVLSGLSLNSGDNYLEITVLGNAAPNLDVFKYNVNPSAADVTYGTFANITSSAYGVTTVEAEALDYTSCVSSNNPSGHPNVENPSNSAETGKTTSGGSEISSLGVKGNTFGLTVNSTVAADLSIDMVASNGTPADQVLDDIINITWNGVQLKTKKTLTWSTKWFDWEDVMLEGLSLKAGDNQLRIEVVENSAPNLDCFKFITDPKNAPETYATYANITSSEATTYTIEAESLDYSHCVNSNNHEIQPNVETPATTTSGGKSIGGLGVAGNEFGMTLNSTVSANVSIDFVVSSGSGAEQVMDDIIKITWNGTEIKTGHTISWNGTWHNWETATVSGQTLNTGDNVLRIEVLTSSPNFDCFKFNVTPAA